MQKLCKVNVGEWPKPCAASPKMPWTMNTNIRAGDEWGGRALSKRMRWGHVFEGSSVQERSGDHKKESSGANLRSESYQLLVTLDGNGDSIMSACEQEVRDQNVNSVMSPKAESESASPNQTPPLL